MVVQLDGFTLLGLALPGKTTNEGGRSAIDCGRLWQDFSDGNYAGKIPEKVGNELYAVYHSYEGDHTMPFSYFIGYRVPPGTEAAEGLQILDVPQGTYEQVVARGKMPDCVAAAWQDVWISGRKRAYRTDFELYGESSQDWDDAEVSIYLSV